MSAAIAVSAHLRRALVAALAIAAAVAAGAPASASAALPEGFESQPTITGLTGATGVAYAPDGRAFVIEKDGVLKVATKGSSTATTLLDIKDHVNNFGDRGLLGVAVDRDFATNGYVYLLYTYNVGLTQDDWMGAQTSRLSRVTVLPDSTLADPADPETVLLGSIVGQGCPPLSNTVDCIPSEGTSHSIGSVRVDPDDGTLFVGSGDGADFGAVDELALQTYDEQTYRGKILHIDRNGNGLPGHAFCPGDANLTHVCTKVYAKGFRNPFRFKLRPEGGLTVGDVGWNTWEEIDLIDGPGGNYGWPCYEAHTHTPGYEDLEACSGPGGLYANEGGPNAAIYPDWKYNRQDGGSAVVGGPTYVGDQYPASYQGSIFFGDYTGNFIKRLILKPNGDVDHVETFATDWIGTALETAPNGNLVAANFGTGAPGDGYIEEYVYTPGNATPVVSATATPTAGSAPLSVAFSSAGTTDADGDSLAYSWSFGDGGTSTDPNPTHVYTQPGTFTATLTVDDGRGKSASKSVTITPGGDAPTVEIQTPTSDSLYRDGSVVQLEGTATDEQDGSLSGSALTWIVRLVHASEFPHFHPIATLTGTQASFTALRDHDDDSYYEIRLIAKDSAGLTSEKTVDIHPETVPLTIESVPAGAPISYGGRPFATPSAQTTAIGYDTTVSTAERFSLGTRRFQFSRWSDGGWLVHDIRVPDAAFTLTASYVEDFAYGRAATASSVEAPAYAPEEALDDSALTRWSSQAEDEQWWQVDLGAVKAIDAVEVDWEAAYASEYRVLTSLDGATWSEAATATASAAGTRATAFALRGARYVRVEALARVNPGWGISAYDIRVLGPLDGTVTPPDPPGGDPPGGNPPTGDPPGGNPSTTEPPGGKSPDMPRDVPAPILPPVDATPPPHYQPRPADRTRPVVTRLRLRTGKRGRRVVTLRLSERGTVTVRVKRRVRGHWRRVRLLTKRVPRRGFVRLALPRSLKAGSYRLLVSASDRAANTTKRRSAVAFRVR